MKDSNRIEEIIESFRMLLSQIFDSAERRDLIKMIFSPECEDMVDRRIEEYFQSQCQKFPYDRKELEIMQDGIQYLMEKIRESSEMMRLLLYTTLFSETDVHSQEVKDIFDLY